MGLRDKLKQVVDDLIEEGRKPGLKPEFNGKTCTHHNCDEPRRGNSHFCERHLGCL